ncbi:MAG: hypothetical protein HYW89_03790 [Candidatus Sungiibacteriota bacterium]|uniref:Uncharacterized protein n=1 Tax=Candidatus Sungiibacteriota bacterium TaxID=2750080 RepID=A0A7T5RJ59_9BACT|nr:MAG: hypothetical protein HYW89_03790 [Candidatus Sungbacteria bacterium]
MGRPGRIKREACKERDELIARLKEQGFDRVIMIKGLAKCKEFRDVSSDAIKGYVKRYEARGGKLPELKTPAPPKKLFSGVMVAATNFQLSMPAKSFLDAILNEMQLRLTIPAMREIDRFLRRIRPEVRRLEAEALRVQALLREIEGLKEKLAEWSNHSCPEVDLDIRDANAKLQERVSYLEKRVQALSELAGRHRPLDDQHLAVSSRAGD